MLAHHVFSKHFNSRIQMSKRWKKQPTLYVSFSLVKHRFKIKWVTRYISYNHVSTFVLFQITTFKLAPLLFIKSFGFWKTEGKYRQHYMLDFQLLWVLTSAYFYSLMKDKYPKFYVSSSCLFKTFKSLI